MYILDSTSPRTSLLQLTCRSSTGVKTLYCCNEIHDLSLYPGFLPWIQDLGCTGPMISHMQPTTEEEVTPAYTHAKSGTNKLPFQN